MLIDKILSFRQGAYPIWVHPDLVEVCDGDYCAALLLFILLNWTAWKQIGRPQARKHNEGLLKRGLSASQITDTWIFMSLADFEKELGKRKDTNPPRKPLFARDTISKALKFLEETKKFLEVRYNPYDRRDNTLQYKVDVEKVQAAIAALPLLAVEVASSYDISTDDLLSQQEEPQPRERIKRKKITSSEKSEESSEKSIHSNEKSEESSEKSEEVSRKIGKGLPKNRQTLPSEFKPLESSSESARESSSHHHSSGSSPKQEEQRRSDDDLSLSQNSFSKSHEKQQSSISPPLSVQPTPASSQGHSQAKKGPPPEPPKDVPWNADTMLAWIQWRHGHPYTDKDYIAEERSWAEKFLDLEWEGEPISRELADIIYEDMLTWFKSGRIDIGHMVRKDVALRVLQKIKSNSKKSPRRRRSSGTPQESSAYMKPGEVIL